MINDILSKVKEASKLIKDASDDFNTIKSQEVTKITSIPTRTITHSDVDIPRLKRKFGEMFYGLLEPINGSLPENRRFSDGSSKHQGQSTPEGPCVFHRIGDMARWSSRAYWYDSDRVFSKLRQKHVDLVVDGTRVRKDHQKVAQDFMDAKIEIEEKIGKVNDYSVSLDLSKKYTLNAIVYKHTNDNLSVPSMLIKVEIDKASIHSEDIHLHYDISPSDLSRLNNAGITSSYQQNGYIKLPLTSHITELPRDGFDYSSYIVILGLDTVYTDFRIDNHFTNSVKLKAEALKVIEDLEDKYSSRLIAQGMF